MQQPDTKPGFYYVSVQRKNSNAGAPETRLLRGPFVNDHAAALAAVGQAQRQACALDQRAHWYSYGTCRSDTDLGPGILDKILHM